MKPKTSGERIRAERLRQGLTQKELAQRAGVTETSVRHVERSSGRKRAMKTTSARRYAEALGVPVEYVLSGDSRRDRPSLSRKIPWAQYEVLEELERAGAANPLSMPELNQRIGKDTWRALDALQRRGLVTCDRTMRPHKWRLIQRKRTPGVLEVLSEVTAQVVVGTDGRRYLLIPLGDDLRDT